MLKVKYYYSIPYNILPSRYTYETVDNDEAANVIVYEHSNCPSSCNINKINICLSSSIPLSVNNTIDYYICNIRESTTNPKIIPINVTVEQRDSYLRLFDQLLTMKNIQIQYGINRFDQLYFINLNHRKDRLAHIGGEIKKTNMNLGKVFRVEACYIPAIGGLGCTKSHICALENFLKTDETIQTCIIFEDDFCFIKDQTYINQTIERFFKDIPDWDVLSLGMNIFGAERVTDYLLKITDGQTTSGYCVNKKFAQRLLDNYKESAQLLENENKIVGEYCLDIYMKKLQPNSNWYCIEPKIGKQAPSYSDIEKRYIHYAC